MKRNHILYIHLVLGLTLLMTLLTGCVPSEDPGTPPSSTAEEPVASSPSISPSALPQISGEYVSAEFGAPVDGTGCFPLDPEIAAALRKYLPLDRETLSRYKTVAAEQYYPLIVLNTSDGGAISLGKVKSQLLLCVEDAYYDCTGHIDFEHLCTLLESAQLRAVIASFPKITELSFVDPEDSARNQRFSPDEAQLLQVSDLLSLGNWSIADLYTAQDLSRGWPDFIDLYSNEVKIARLARGDVGGSLHTVIFYYIDGNENQRAFLLAPSELYQNLRALFVPSQAVPAEGTDGSSSWQFDRTTGTLTFRGSGSLSESEMKNADDTAYGWSALSNEVTSVIIGEGITRIPNCAFYRFTNLQSVTLPSTLKSIGTHAFFKCAFSELELPDELEEIGPCAFSHCQQLTSCEIPGSVRILEYVFEECISLQSLYLNEGTEVLKEGCLFGCDSLKTLTVPASVTSVEELYAPTLNTMIFLGDCPELAYHEESGKFYFIYTGTVYYPADNDTWTNFISCCEDESITWIEGTSKME